MQGFDGDEKEKSREIAIEAGSELEGEKETDSRKRKSDREEIAGLKNELKKSAEEVKDLKDKYLRAVAELQNYRKRARKEIRAAYEASSDRLLCDILPVVDNLERALEQSKTCEAETFRDGVRMIRDMLKAVLEDEGVKEFCSVGESFDPARHEAVFAVESDEFPPEVVVEEIEKGYLMKDRLLRPARVTVSKGSPVKPADDEDDLSGSGEDDGNA